MKMVYCVAALAGVLSFTGCTSGGGGPARGASGPHSSNPLILRAHFIGTEQLFADTNAARLKEIWNLKSSTELRRATLARVATLPRRFLGDALPANAPDQAAVFRPLLDDLLAREFYLDARATPEFVLAVRLADDRAKAWQDSLSQAAKNWKLGTPANLTGAGLTGWEIKRAGSPHLVRVARMKEWLIVSAGQASPVLESNLLATIRATGRPARATGAWLDGDANLARFSGWLPWLAHYDNAPLAHFALSNRADFVRTLVTLDFGKPHGWKLEEWRVPTNHIFDPLANFTAARGIAPLLDDLPWVRELGYKPVPNQVVGWGNQGLPFQVFYAAPSQNVTNQLKRLESKIGAMIFPKGRTNLIGSLAWDTNRSELFWRGLPLASPQLGAIHDGGTEFLEFRLFPMARTRQQAPRELLAQIHGRPNLVYYDWEITEYRLPHWRQVYQLAEIVTRRALTATNAPSQRWLTEVGPKLGESVTEITTTSPTQMTLVRRSHAGLTAFELATLARWVESTNFPAFGIFPAQPAPRARPARAGQRGR